jgi:GR25 family glycosyltransferase involved in LPS biosynthesis
MDQIEEVDGAINKYFDKIFIINLKKRIDRRDSMIKKLKIAGITNYEFIHAIDGSQQPYYNHYLNFRIRNQFFEGPGAYGILMSALKILIWSKIKKYNRILILEDDAIFHKNFTKTFNERIKNVSSWKLLYLGTSLHEWRFSERCSINKAKSIMTSTGTIAGAFAVGIDSSVFDLLINSIYVTGKPWDIGPLRNVNVKYNKDVIILYPYLVVCETEDSNLRDSRSIRTTAKECCWDLSLYDYEYKKQ